MKYLFVAILLSGYAIAECAITTATLPKGKAGEFYSATVQTSGCGVGLTFSIADGALPTGVEWASGGNLTGTPTRDGWYYTKAAVKGSGGSASAVFWTEIMPSKPSSAPADVATGTKHQVSLSWQPPVPAPNSYSVYRATSPGGPYQRLAGGVNGRTWKDSVPGGTTYYYVVTAVANGMESVCSQSVKAVVP